MAPDSAPAFANAVPALRSWTSSVSASPLPHSSRQCASVVSRRCRCRPRSVPRMDVAGEGIYAPNVKPSDVRVVIFGATGYIGRIVVREFCNQGYAVTAFARPRAGVGGKKSTEDVRRDLAPARVVFGEVTDPATIQGAFDVDTAEGKSFASTVVVSCLASRTGGIADSERIDYQATSDALKTSLGAGAKHFILLSAVCVQKPLLAFQRAKLRFEAELSAAAEADPAFSYSIVRPTAFFKSLAAQVDSMKKGLAYVMFNDGLLAKCNALSERDLARFIVLCAREESKRNEILPVGGPGAPVTPKEQADIIFRLLGKKPSYWSVPIGVMNLAIGALDNVARVFPGAADAAEFSKIGKYYATEDMVGPSFGEDTLEEFFAKALREGGMAEQDLGDAKVFF